MSNHQRNARTTPMVVILELIILIALVVVLSVCAYHQPHIAVHAWSSSTGTSRHMRSTVTTTAWGLTSLNSKATTQTRTVSTSSLSMQPTRGKNANGGSNSTAGISNGDSAPLFVDATNPITSPPSSRSPLKSRTVSTAKSSPTVLKSTSSSTFPPYRWSCPVLSDVCSQTGVTLSRYMLEMTRCNPELADIESIFTSLQTATKTISKLVRRSSLDGTTGLQGNVNVQGEDQKKLDVITNDVLKQTLKWTGKLGTIASEEEDEPMMVDNLGNNVYSSDLLVNQEGRYVAVFDPLDGSSNVDANIPTGTIFGIFANDDNECIIDDDGSVNGDDLAEFLGTDQERCLQNVLQPGTNLVAAGYVLYSSATTLMFTMGCGVNGFTLDESIGEYVLTHPHVQIPNRGKIYSFNEANRWDWPQPVQDYVTDIQQGRGDTKSRYTSRYVGSMVADVHRTLLYGGIFGYPGDKTHPDGKLRLLYEAAPMSFLVEQAGGMGTTGMHRIMDVKPLSVHQRVPCILGSREDVAELRRYFEKSNDPDIIGRCKARLEGATRALMPDQQVLMP